MNSTKELLESLKQSADDPTAYHEGIIRRLVYQLPGRTVFRLAFQQAYSFLPIFEEFHPDITWPREYLDVAQHLRPIDYSEHHFRFYDEEVDENPPRIFIKAFGNIDSAVRAWIKGKTSGENTALGIAISRIFYAKMDYLWMQCNPESRKIMESLASATEEEVQTLKEFKRSVQWKDLIKDLVTSFADEIEAVISESA